MSTEQERKEILTKYDDAIATAQKQDPDANPKAVHDAIAKINQKIKEKATKDQLSREIKELSDSSLRIDESFYEIETTLTEVVETGKGVSPALKGDLSELLQKWKELRETYVNALWDSRDMAGTAQTFADDFVDVFLDHLQRSDNMQQQKDDIMEYIETLNKQEYEARKFTDEFKNLSFEVTTFQTRWKALITQGIDKYTNEKIEQLTKEIEEFEITMVSIENKITLYTAAIGVLTTTAAVTGVVGIWFPATWIATLAAAIGDLAVGALLLSARSDREVLQRRIKDKKDDRTAAEANLETIHKLDAGLLASKDSFTTMCTKLGALASVWALIRSDLQRIEGKLDMALSDPDSANLYKVRLENATIMYSVLAQGLRDYQINVVLPKKDR